MLNRTNRVFVSQIRRYAAPGEGTIPAAKKKYVPTSGTYPLGFKAGSAHVGVKASNTRFDDLALIASDTPCVGAAVFTTNRFKAAPVTVSTDILKSSKVDSKICEDFFKRDAGFRLGVCYGWPTHGTVG